VQEGVALIGFGLGGELVGAEGEGAVDILVDEGVDGLETRPEGGAGDDPGYAFCAGDEALDALDFVEGFGEGFVGFAGFLLLAECCLRKGEQGRRRRANPQHRIN